MREETGATADFAGVGAYSVLGAGSSPVVFDSPHSGRHYPERFLALSRLGRLDVRRSEDAFVDELFSGACGHGAALLRAHFPRAYLDANREAGELDPRLFADTLPPTANSRSPRVAGGLGVIPRIVGEGADIYSGRLPLSEAAQRIESCYRPYHAALRGLVVAAQEAHGRALLVDCHSMPGNIRSGNEAFRPDIIVGDRFGRSASADISEAVIGLLTGFGYRVAHNKPYAGGYITEHYGRPAQGLHAVQIEINRALYMNERTIEPSDGFAALKGDLTAFSARLLALMRDIPTPALAAE